MLKTSNPNKPVPFGQTTHCVLPFEKDGDIKNELIIVGGEATPEKLADAVIAAINKNKEWQPLLTEIVFEKYIDGGWWIDRVLFVEVAAALARLEKSCH
jgi:hypothetical protein